MEDLSSSPEEMASELAELLLRPLTEVWSGMKAKLSGEDGSAPFILHRNQWSRLVELFSSSLNFFKLTLEDKLRMFIASLRCLFSAMEAAMMSFDECIAPHARGYLREVNGSGRGAEEEYVWTGTELGDAEEKDEQRKRREDVRLWMAKHALRHILDREVPYRHADNFRIAYMAHIILYRPLLPLHYFNVILGVEEMMSDLSDDTREARAFFSHEEIAKIDISQLLLRRVRDEENVEAAVELLFVDRAQFHKCDDDSGSENLGEGGFGSVKLRKWISDDHHVAVKKGKLGRQEMGIQARIRHPNLLPLLCCSTPKRKEEMAFPVVERMDCSLDKLTTIRSQPLVLEVDMMLQIAKGMEYLHSHDIIHRDLKPANILVSGYPDYDDSFESPELRRSRWAFLRVKVADFGVSKMNFQTSDSSNTLNVGSGLYRAPEVLEGHSNRRKWWIGQSSRATGGYSKKADVYSFAMVCYRILTGKEPFHDDSRPQHVLLQKIRDEALRPKFDSDDYWEIGLYDCWLALKGMVEECWHRDASRRPEFAEIAEFLRLVKVRTLQPKFYQGFVLQRGEELFQDFCDMGYDLAEMLDHVRRERKS